MTPRAALWAPDRLEPGPAGGLDPRVERLVRACTEVDGAAPLDEAALLRLRAERPTGTLLLAGTADDVTGLAWRRDGMLDLTVHPAHRGAGTGRALLDRALADGPGPVTAWSHGHHPAAARLAAATGFERVRDLWVLRRSLADLPPLTSPPTGVVVRAFEPGQDEEPLLALNAEAFAGHPEQGALTRADLDLRLAEDWFDPEGLFVADAGGRLVGFHWTKVHTHPRPAGEVYVVGVSPSAQGGGLGRTLTLTGLHHLAGRGLAEVLLYVEADNVAALAVYRRLGFVHAAEDTHVMYCRP